VKLFRTASQKLFKIITLATFIIHLAQPINLSSAENWEVGICEFSCPLPNTGTFKPVAVKEETNVLIYYNLIYPQFEGNNYVCCLRTFIFPSACCQHIFNELYDVPVEQRKFQDIGIEILTPESKCVHSKDSTETVKLVLHFGWTPAW